MIIKKILFLITFLFLNLFFCPFKIKAVETEFNLELIKPTPTPTAIPTSTTSDITSNSNGGGGWSATPCNAIKPASAPIILSAASGVNSVTLTWLKATNPVTNYLVSYGTKTGSIQYGNPDVGDANTTSYTVRGLSGGTRYYFKIKAINDCMPGDFSNEISAMARGQLIITTTAIGTTITTPAEGFVPISQLPSQLFDIALIVDQPKIINASDLAARVTFVSFGTEDTPVEMTFTIVDASGQEYYRSVNNTIIQTEGVFNKTFIGLVLAKGKYQLVLNTLYHTNIKDEFKQNFEVGDFSLSQTTNVLSNKPLIISVGMVIIFGFVMLIIKILNAKRLKNIKRYFKK